MTEYRDIVSLIKKEPTDIWGLCFFPSLEPELHNDRDGPPYNAQLSGRPVNSDCNLEVVRAAVAEIGNGYASCLEIGISREGGRSFTEILIKNKPAGSFYLGVDMEDKKYVDKHESNIWTLQCNSHDQDTIRDFLASKGISQLDILFIDGWHSVNTAVNDWRYADLLSPHGIVIMHDTNHHPGPVALCEAIDPKLFEVTKHCLDTDYGIAVIRRRA